MDEVFIENEDFQDRDFSKQMLSKGDYEDCRFVNCLFTESDLTDINFATCEFATCDFSMATVTNTAFREKSSFQIANFWVCTSKTAISFCLKLSLKAAS